MDDLLSEFLTETSESLAMLDVELVRLEQHPNDPELLGNIFRLVHTIKGTCGFLGLPRLEAVAHASENVLGRIRDGELEVTATAVSLVLESIDRIKEILSVLEATEAEPAGDDEDLIERLNALAEGRAIEVAAPNMSDDSGETPSQEDFGPFNDELAAELAELEAKLAAERAGTTGNDANSDEKSGKNEEVSAGPPATRQQSVATIDAEPAADVETAPRESAVASQTIRVSVDLLENLMTMVSELVLTRNQLLQIVRHHKDSEFTVPLQRLSHVTSELQEGVMKTRMQPIGNAWAKLPRLVRDLSLDLDKKIDLQMIGAETELDRQVLDLIKDPLTHMVRNSADHGIEVPAERAAAGKSETGRVTLNAYHEGGHIIIEISDDGRGLALEKIRAKAISNGIASELELDGMSDQQIMQFIFKPGFSTAAKVTSVSGRGVGMDVVRTNIEKIGGTIEFKSAAGRGSTFIIKIPLTLAIVAALIVESCGERFAIPQISVVELVRATRESENRIEHIKGTPVLRLRDRLLPLVSLQQLLHLDREPEASHSAGGASFIVVTQVGTYSFGIMVDRVFDTEEIVVKPVAPILRHITMFSGNTILGDGSVIMILDPNGIAQATGEIAASDRQLTDGAAGRAHREDGRTALLLFRAGDRTPKAVPLALVARLEEIDLSTVEYSERRPIVQYRGQLMPLVTFGENLELKQEGQQPVIVFTDENKSMGLVVDEIVDIVEERISVELSAERAGMIGNAVIAGKATDMIDAGHFLHQAFADWFDSQGGEKKLDGASGGRRVLLVDDSAFFRNLLTPLLSVAGYEVTPVESGARALDLHEAGEDFDCIISDIEMPGMTGFALAEAVRKSDRWQKIPLVALSSHTAPRDLKRGHEVGFDDYVAKFDRDGLLQTLAETLADA